MTPPIEAAKAGTADGPQPRKKERLMLPDCGGTMWKLHLALLAALAPALFAPPTMAQQGAAEALTKSLGPEVIAGCQQELTRYCDAVTPGEGRLLACLFAHEDRLSGRCDYALYHASAQLERAIAAVAHVASACEADITTYCARVEMGEGRIVQCLEAARDKVSESCRQAMQEMQDTGLR
jgi:hypothetical protein